MSGPLSLQRHLPLSVLRQWFFPFFGPGADLVTPFVTPLVTHPVTRVGSLHKERGQMCPGFRVFASLANLSENASIGPLDCSASKKPTRPSFSMREMAQKLDQKPKG